MQRLTLLGDVDVPYDEMAKLSRVIDLDIDIGADAVDYKFRSFPFFAFCMHVQVLTFFFTPQVPLPTKNPYPASKQRCANSKG